MRADADKIMRLLKTARGQIDGIMKMVKADEYCMNISHQVLSCEAILRKANKEIVRCHMHGCVKEALKSNSEELADRNIDELTKLIDKMSK